MNLADSQRVASALEKLGYRMTRDAESADVIVLNTCVVRQSAEDKAYARLMSLKPLKEARPDLVLALMGCLVGVRDASPLKKRFPFVDVFLPPSDPTQLIELLRARESPISNLQSPTDYDILQHERETRYELQDAELVLPVHERGNLVSAYIPIIYGCNHVCTFCIIPYRRGRERSRSIGEIVAEARALVRQGVKEITLLGQIVDRYGYDVGDEPRLHHLLRILNDIEGLERIRFLTSHPLYLTDELLDTVASLPKVCEYIEVPVQSGD
ncbi:MAG: radical SAM protein, partial [Anaerolineae bacterium]|nr:radical SAM protein [Anaerolineae bacterium]